MHASCGNRAADGIRMGIGVDQAVGGPKLPQSMDIAIADDRFSTRSRPAFCAKVEVDTPREHRVPLDRVEQLLMPIELAP